jgi:hypothetical protein
VGLGLGLAGGLGVAVELACTGDAEAVAALTAGETPSAASEDAVAAGDRTGEADALGLAFDVGRDVCMGPGWLAITGVPRGRLGTETSTHVACR